MQARHTEREAGRRHVLAHEAADETVVAPAGADRAEADGAAVLAFDLEVQVRLEHGAGVVLQAADDGGTDKDSVLIASRRDHGCNSIKFPESLFTNP